MIISIFLDLRKRLTPPNIEPRGATKTGFRPVSAGIDGVLGGGRPRHAVRACSFDDLTREAEAANAR
jgi:hypothetical protein